MIKEYLNQPYPLYCNKWTIIFSISLFITFFTLVFKPFGLSSFQGSNKILIIAGYGGITFIILIINLFFISSLFKSWFDNNKWTVKKQIFWLFWIVFTIGMGNYLYTSYIFSIWALRGFLLFQFYTVVVGIIPIAFLTIVQQNIYLTQNLKSAKEFNDHLINKDNLIESQIINLTGENQKDKFEIELSKLLYIESTGNYIDVYYINGNQIKNTILRSTLKRTEIQLAKYPSLVKCHRAFIVNINKIIHVKGNSQGLRLVVKNTATEIPVSRNLSKNLKDIMSSYRLQA